MAVRFLPAPDERPRAHRDERENLAEVIEFRARVKRPEPPSVVEDLAAKIEHIQDGSDEFADHAGAEEAVTEPVGPTAEQAAIKLLARKALSSGELRRKLREADYPEIDVEEAVAACEAALYLDDAGLASAVTQKLRETKGASQAIIRRKLRERLLPDAAIDQAIAELDDSEEFELLEQTAADRARRLQGLDRQTAERRLLGFLARRGWSGERATRAARNALNGLDRAPGSGVRFR